MNRFTLLLTILGISIPAMSETVGGWDGTVYHVYGTGAEKYHMATQTTPPPAVQTAPAVAPAETRSTTASEIFYGERPLRRPERFGTFHPRLVYKDGSNCPTPQAHNNAAQTPVEVYVNQTDPENQTITIKVFGNEQIEVTGNASAGGTFKRSNGKIKQRYCAQTQPQNGRIISAVTPEMFKGTGCSPSDIRSMSTVFDVYDSQTWSDQNDNPIPLKNAVRIVGGTFFHTAPTGTEGDLGKNVSGDCVRLADEVAKFLKDKIMQYGAIKVYINDPPQLDHNHPRYCNGDAVKAVQGTDELSDALARALSRTPKQ